MTYYGLQPVLRDANLPNILKSDLGLFLSGSDTPLPCIINNIDINNEYTIPMHPIDTNQLIADTIIKKPTTISLELFVYEEDENAFTSLIQQGTYKGFYFINRTKTTYNNLFLTSKGMTFGNDRFGGFVCSLELQEVMKVETLESDVILPTKSKRVDRGDVSTKKVDPKQVADKNKKSCLKGLFSMDVGNCLDRVMELTKKGKELLS